MNIEQLQASIEAASLPTPPPVNLKIEPIDLKAWEWDAFDDFFDKPEAKSLIYQSGAPLNLIVPCSFFSVVNSDKQRAIELLYTDLLHIKNLCSGIPGSPEGFNVVAFLAKPSTIEIVVPTKEGEVSDTTTYVDLRGPVPAKRKYAAFCFLFAYRDGFWMSEKTFGYKNISVSDWNGLGLPSAVREGEVGRDTDDLLLAAGEGLKTAIEAIDEPEEPELAPQKIIDTPIAPMTELAASGGKTTAETVATLHPEIQAAADKYGIDLRAKPGRELEEMRKYFGQGSGLYLVTVDFQTARTEAFKLDDRAQKKIAKALKPSKKRAIKRAKVARKPIKKRVKRKPVRRSKRG